MVPLQDIPETSGIYRIVCTITGKFYIGSAINLRTRWIGHRSELRRKDHPNQKLQHAWDKYGEDAFIFEIIEFILSPFLLEREQYWLDKLKPFGNVGLNIAHNAQSPRRGMTTSLATRAKQSAARKGRSNLTARQPKSQATRTRMSESARRRWESRTDRTVSEQTRLRRSLALTGHKQSTETCTRKSVALTGKKYKKRSA